MKRTFKYTIIFALIISVCGCEKSTPNQDINVVSQFIYDGMSAFYLWSDGQNIRKPTANDNDAQKYFKNILYAPTDEWSWITDDVDEMLADFEGTNTNGFGFNPRALWTNSNYEEIVGLVRYVLPNTPAQRAGLKRGDIIIAINGNTIVESNYLTLYGANSKTSFTILDQATGITKTIDIIPERITSDPVLFYDTYEIDGKKIGYLFYTSYVSGFNNSLYRVFEKFKTDNITDLVLDLRYNPGGSVSTAGYLLSLIAPKDNVQNKDVFTKMSYNNFVNSVYDRNGWERADRLGSYDKSKDKDPLSANIDLNKVYIITTNQSASASELTTFCLRPFMDVIHIGEDTSGKYTASWTVHAYNSFGNRAQTVYLEKDLNSDEKSKLKNWAMQPIVGRYTDKDEKDFVETGTLKPDYPIISQELNISNWKPIGDENDYLFAKAISLITGREYNENKFKSSDVNKYNESDIQSPIDKHLRRAVLFDNIHIIP